MRGKYLYSLFYVITLVALSGCATRMAFTARDDQGTDVSFSMDMGAAIADTVRSFSSGMMNPGGTGADGEPIFSAPAIRQAFAESDFTGVTATVPGPASVSVAGTIPSAAHQKYAAADGLKVADFVSCGTDSLTVRLSPRTIRLLAGSLPEDTRSYLDLFMAPVFTGEKMSPADYRGLVAAVYGEELAREMMAATVEVTLAPPAGKKIRRASASGKKPSSSSSRAEFSIPLAEFLTLQSARTFSIQWD